MPKDFRVYRNFNRGLNDSTAEDILLEQELAKAQNITLTSRGGYFKRDGCVSKLNSGVITSADIHSMVRFASGVKNERLFIHEKKLLRHDSTTAVTVLQSGLNSNNVDFQFFTNGKLYFVDGAEYRVYDGTTVSAVVAASGTSLTHIKRCTMIEQRGQRMFAAGDPQNPNTLYYSEIGEPNKFLAASAIVAISDDGDSLTGLVELEDKLIAFKNRNIYAWTGWDPTSDVSFDRLPIRSGTDAPGSIVKVDNMIIFLAHDAILGLMVGDGGYISVVNLSVNLENTVLSLINRDKVKAIYYRGSYFMSCCDDSELNKNNLVLRGYVNFAYSAPSDRSGQTKTIPWTTIRGWSVSCWLHDIDEDLYFGTTSGRIMKAFESKADDGSPVVVDVIHRLNLADSFRTKKLKSVLLLVSQETHKLSDGRLYLDFGYNSEIFDLDLNEAMSWGIPWGYKWGYTDIIKKEIRINKSADRLQLRLTQNEVNESTENDLLIYGFGIVFRTKRPKGDKGGITSGSNN